MRIRLTKEGRIARGFYLLAKAFIQSHPVMAPWEIISWMNYRLGIGEQIHDSQLAELKNAWNDLGLADWDRLIAEKDLAESIV